MREVTSQPRRRMTLSSTETREARFTRVYEQHHETVRRYVWRRDPDIVDDVIAETFLIAWRRLDEIPEQAAPVEVALRALTPRDREVLLLAVWDGLDRADRPRRRLRARAALPGRQCLADAPRGLRRAGQGGGRRRRRAVRGGGPDTLPAVSEEHDYRAEYNEAVRRAIAGEVGIYRDFDRHRQETVWRLLSSDRQALLRFCQRQGISVGKMETMQTLKSPKPLLQLIAHGHDADTVARWARRA